MSDNNELYEPDLISVTDDDGNEIVFELLERYETDDDVYVAITEYHDEAEEIVEADNEVIILKVLEENGEEYLAEIEDEMEFEQVYDLYFRDVYRYILKLSGSEHVAEEITSDTFFKALRSIGKFRGSCDMRVWLCQIAKNCYYTYLRKEKHTTPLEELPESVGSADTP